MIMSNISPEEFNKISLLNKYNELFAKNKLLFNDYKNYLTLLLNLNDFEKFKKVIKVYERLDVSASTAFEITEHTKTFSVLNLSFYTAKSDFNKATFYADYLLKSDYHKFDSKLNIEIAFEIASYYTKFKFFNKAILLYSTLLKKTTTYDYAELGLDNKYLQAKIYQNLSDVYYRKLDKDHAVVFSKKSLQLYEKVLPDNAQEINQAKNNYAMFLQLSGQYEESLNLLNEVLKKNITFYGENHIKVAKNKYNIGMCLYKLKKYAVATSYFEDSYQIKSKHADSIEPGEELKTLLYKALSCSHHLTLDNYKEFISNLYKTQPLVDLIKETNKEIIKDIDKSIDRLTSFILNNYKTTPILPKDYTEIFKSIYSGTLHILIINFEIPRNIEDILIYEKLPALDVTDYIEFLYETYQDSEKQLALFTTQILSLAKELAILDAFEIYPDIDYDYFYDTIEHGLNFKLYYRERLLWALEEIFGSFSK